MNGLPYYKAYPRDFIEGTIGMPFEVKCAYRVVLDLIYMQGGNLPDDARYISGLLGCSLRKWEAIRGALVEAGKLQVSGRFLTNYRAVSELETLSKLQDKQRENASGPRKNKGLEKPRLGHTEPEPDISLSTESSNARAAQPQPKEVEKARFPDFILPEVERNFRSFRSKSKRPLTDRAIQLMAKDLQSIKDRGGDPNEALDICCERGWSAPKPEYYFNALERLGRKPASKPAYVPKVPETDEQWARTVHLCRLQHQWPAYLGPAPDMDGCKAPAHLLTPKDRREYWRIMQVAS